MMTGKKETDLDMKVEIDRTVHEPVRLKIMAFLSVVESADFVFLISRMGLTMGNLSAHISKLKEAGYIDVHKGFKDNRPHTMVSLTKSGREAFERYREDMLQLLE